MHSFISAVAVFLLLKTSVCQEFSAGSLPQKQPPFHGSGQHLSRQKFSAYILVWKSAVVKSFVENPALLLHGFHFYSILEKTLLWQFYGVMAQASETGAVIFGDAIYKYLIKFSMKEVLSIMRIADGWKEYEVIDTSKGEKLERWGDYLLVRPDPQVIWDTPRKNRGWKHMNGHYHRSSRGGGEWEFFDLPHQWEIHYKDLTFNLKPFSFKHTGLFPEQAVNWDWFGEKIRNAGRPIKVLNLFAYTGGATLAAAAAGASVTHVDASKGMVTWAKENAAASGLSGAPIRWLVDDCVKFVEREIRRGNHYDAIIMDPPSYGRGPKGEIWKIEDAIHPLIKLCTKILSDDPLFFLVNSYTTGLAPAVLTYMLATELKPWKGSVESQEIGLPVTESGLVLPCGASGRWCSSR